MLLVSLFACGAPDTTLTEADVDAVHWSGDFAWNDVEDDEGGAVDLLIEQDDAGEWAGTWGYSGEGGDSLYAVTARLDDGTLTLTQTAIVEEWNTDDEHVWCLGEYVIGIEGGDVLNGAYFPATPECAPYVGTARLKVD